jgi:N-acetylmuramic acid 6-phosphate etherase
VERILGVEGGGTRTAWALIEDNDAIVESGKLPASNFRLTARDQLAKIFGALPREAERVGVFLAGCGTAEDRARLTELAREIWPQAKIVVGSDRDSGLAACLRDREGVVVNAGTGSSVTGRQGEQIEKAGGWGHILGDAGGAYFLSIRALRLILRAYDLRRGERKFAANILAATALNNFDELVRWAQIADKTEIAALAPVVFQGAAEGDVAAREIIRAGAKVLAEFAAAVAHRLKLNAPEVRLMGGLFEHQPTYVEEFAQELRAELPAARISLADTAPEIGACWLAAEGSFPASAHADRTAEPELIAVTEKANPKSAGLEQLNARELVELIIGDEQSVESALREATADLARAVEIAAESLRNGGRIFYVGAGTSGRLGVLDAAEIPPTFGMRRETVQGIIAGGAVALQRAVEGAEDDERSGALAVDLRDVGRQDLVIGISASGRAAFVHGALRQSRTIGAQTILITCNPDPPAFCEIDQVIVLPTGPEIVAGSTRLKSGTATKIALNIISTGAMVRLGRVQGNLMIDLQPTNRKLRERAVRLVAQLANCDRAAARLRLERAGWNVRAAVSLE